MGDVRQIISQYVDACDTRVEVLVDGSVVNSQEYSAADWVHANRAYGRLACRGLHVRLVSTGLIEHTISEVFGLLQDGYHCGPCPACGAVCMVRHEQESDATGRRIVAQHWGNDHSQCHPDGCHEEPATQQRGRIRTRRER